MPGRYRLGVQGVFHTNKCFIYKWQQTIKNDNLAQTGKTEHLYKDEKCQ